MADEFQNQTKPKRLFLVFFFMRNCIVYVLLFVAELQSPLWKGQHKQTHANRTATFKYLEKKKTCVIISNILLRENVCVYQCM